MKLHIPNENSILPTTNLLQITGLDEKLWGSIVDSGAMEGAYLKTPGGERRWILREVNRRLLKLASEQAEPNS